MSMLPYNNPDKIIDREDSQSMKSGKSVSIQRALSKNKIQEENMAVEPTNQHMMVPIFEDTKMEGKGSQEEEEERQKDKTGSIGRSKKTRLELLAQKKDSSENHHHHGSQAEILIPP